MFLHYGTERDNNGEVAKDIKKHYLDTNDSNNNNNNDDDNDNKDKTQDHRHNTASDCRDYFVRCYFKHIHLYNLSNNERTIFTGDCLFYLRSTLTKGATY